MKCNFLFNREFKRRRDLHPRCEERNQLIGSIIQGIDIAFRDKKNIDDLIEVFNADKWQTYEDDPMRWYADIDNELLRCVREKDPNLENIMLDALPAYATLLVREQEEWCDMETFAECKIDNDYVWDNQDWERDYPRIPLGFCPSIPFTSYSVMFRAKNSDENHQAPYTLVIFYLDQYSRLNAYIPVRGNTVDTEACSMMRPIPLNNVSNDYYDSYGIVDIQDRNCRINWDAIIEDILLDFDTGHNPRYMLNSNQNNFTFNNDFENEQILDAKNCQKHEFLQRLIEDMIQKYKNVEYSYFTQDAFTKETDENEISENEMKQRAKDMIKTLNVCTVLKDSQITKAIIPIIDPYISMLVHSQWNQVDSVCACKVKDDCLWGREVWESNNPANLLGYHEINDVPFYGIMCRTHTSPLSMFDWEHIPYFVVMLYINRADNTIGLWIPIRGNAVDGDSCEPLDSILDDEPFDSDEYVESYGITGYDDPHGKIDWIAIEKELKKVFEL